MFCFYLKIYHKIDRCFISLMWSLVYSIFWPRVLTLICFCFLSVYSVQSVWNIKTWKLLIYLLQSLSRFKFYVLCVFGVTKKVTRKKSRWCVSRTVKFYTKLIKLWQMGTRRSRVKYLFHWMCMFHFGYIHCFFDLSWRARWAIFCFIICTLLEWMVLWSRWWNAQNKSLSVSVLVWVQVEEYRVEWLLIVFVVVMANDFVHNSPAQLKYQTMDWPVHFGFFRLFSCQLFNFQSSIHFFHSVHYILCFALHL